MTSTHLTLQEVSAQLDVSLHTVRWWVKTGKLPSVRPGRLRWVERRELSAFLKRNARGYEGRDD